MEAAYSLYLRGRELLETGNPAQAALVLERAKNLEPEKASVREALGRAYFNYGQIELAQEHFMKATTLHPSDDFAHYCLALCYLRLGQIFNALRHIKLAHAMMPEKKDYQRLLTRVEVQRAREAGA